MKAIILWLTLFSIAGIDTTNNADAIIGVWKNGSGKGHIQIYKNNGKYFGKIVWLRDALDANGKPKVDRKNENPDKRNAPLIGLVMLKDFEYDDGEWNGGHIYNPSDGKEYKAYMKMEDYKTLNVRGYVGISLFGKTDVWTRVR
ncbi:MAG: DUF2147 domain-containing protein [Flavisolibacter sp.]|jgi:uncharacterized protein (DUF2147 family)